MRHVKDRIEKIYFPSPLIRHYRFTSIFHLCLPFYNDSYSKVQPFTWVRAHAQRVGDLRGLLRCSAVCRIEVKNSKIAEDGLPRPGRFRLMTSRTWPGPGKPSSGTTKSRKMTYRGLANSGL
jgi:hypothetical protein